MNLYAQLNCVSLRVSKKRDPKVKILLSFTHPYFIPNPYGFLSSGEHKMRSHEKFQKTTFTILFFILTALDFINFHCIKKCSMKIMTNF